MIRVRNTVILRRELRELTIKLPGISRTIFGKLTGLCSRTSFFFIKEKFTLNGQHSQRKTT